LPSRDRLRNRLAPVDAIGMDGSRYTGTPRIRRLIAAAVCACLLTIGVAPESGATALAARPKPTIHRAKQPSRPKCKLARRRRGKKLVRVKICPKPVTHKATSPSPGGNSPTATGPTLAPAQPGAGPAPAPTPSPTNTTTEPQEGTPGGASVPGGSSAWEEPALVDPTTVVLSDSSRSLTLSQQQDYIVECPPGQFDVSGKITIYGGHNVVFQNCDEYVTNPAGDWAAYLENQTGTLWVHDVHFGGAHLTGGVQLQEPGATVVMRDVLFDTVYGSYQSNHAECVQTWAGPARYLIDGLECPTTYQGLFLQPNQWDSATVETTWDFRNVRIDGDGAYDLWLADVQPSNLGSLPQFNLENVYDCGYGEPRDMDGSSDGNQAWAGVKPCPPGGGSPPVWSNPDGSVTGADDGTSPAALQGEQP
jgi:hypothetical protein